MLADDEKEAYVEVPMENPKVAPRRARHLKNNTSVGLVDQEVARALQETHAMMPVEGALSEKAIRSIEKLTRYGSSKVDLEKEYTLRDSKEITKRFLDSKSVRGGKEKSREESSTKEMSRTKRVKGWRDAKVNFDDSVPLGRVVEDPKKYNARSRVGSSKSDLERKERNIEASLLRQAAAKNRASKKEAKLNLVDNFKHLPFANYESDDIFVYDRHGRISDPIRFESEWTATLAPPTLRRSLLTTHNAYNIYGKLSKFDSMYIRNVESFMIPVLPTWAEIVLHKYFAFSLTPMLAIDAHDKNIELLYGSVHAQDLWRESCIRLGFDPNMRIPTWFPTYITTLHNVLSWPRKMIAHLDLHYCLDRKERALWRWKTMAQFESDDNPAEEKQILVEEEEFDSPYRLSKEEMGEYLDSLKKPDPKSNYLSRFLDMVEKAFLEVSKCIPGFIGFSSDTIDILHCVIGSVYLLYNSRNDAIGTYFIVYNLINSLFSSQVRYHYVLGSLSVAAIVKCFSAISRYFETPITFENKTWEEIETIIPNFDKGDEMGTSIGKIKGFFTTIIQSPLANAIKVAISHIVSLRYFPPELAEKVNTFLGKPKSGSSLDVCVDIMSSMECIIRAGERFAAGVPFSRVLFSGSPVEDAVATINMLLPYKDFLIYGAPVDGMMPAEEFLAMLLPAIQLLEAKVAKIPILKRQTSYYADYMHKGKSAQIEVEARLLGESRITPLAFALVGPPGIGKGHILNVLYATVAKALNLRYRDNMVYHRSGEAKHWDGYMPMTNPFCHVSDIAFENPEAQKKDMGQPKRELLSIIDSQPMLTDMAFETKGARLGKGSCMVGFKAIFVDSNDMTLGFQYTHNCPASGTRRFIFCEPEVKSEYSTALGQIDPAKVALAPDPRDVWKFVIKRYGGNVMPVVIETICCENMNEFISYAYNYSRTEYSRRSDTKDVFSAANLIDHVDRNYIRYDPENEAKGIAAAMVDAALEAKHESFFSDIRDGVYTLANNAGEIAESGLKLGKACVASVVVRTFAEPAAKTKVNALHEHVDKDLKKAYDDLLSKFKSEDADDVDILIGKEVRKWLGRIALATVALSMLALGISFWRSKPITVETLDIEEVEKAVGSSEQPPATGNIRVTTWNKKVPAFVPPFCGDCPALQKVIDSNIRQCLIFHPGGIQTNTFGIGVCGNYFVLNAHALKTPTYPLKMQVSRAGQSVLAGSVSESLLHERDIVLFGTDLALIALSAIQFRNILGHIQETMGVESGLSHICGSQHPFRLTHNIPITHADFKVAIAPSVYANKWEHHANGLCGNPLLTSIKDRSMIIGLHMAGKFGKPEAYAAIITQALVNKAIEKLNSKIGLVPISSVDMEVIRTQCATGDFVLPTGKTPFRYEYLPGLELYGSTGVKKFVNQKSRVTSTPLDSGSNKGKVQEILFDEHGFIPSTTWSPPLMKPKLIGDKYMPYNEALKSMSKQRRGLDREILRKICDDAFNKTMGVLRSNGITRLAPATLRDAINGPDADDFFRRINAHTSAGPGFSGKKSEYIKLGEDGITRHPTQELIEQINIRVTSMMKGESIPFVYNVCLKDEPVKTAKALIGKTRLFYIQSLVDLILFRMFFDPYFTKMVQFGDAFDTAVGIDMATETHKVVDVIFSGAKVMDSDVKSYDLEMNPDINWAAATVDWRILKAMGYNDVAMKFVELLLSSDLFPIYSLFGEYFKAWGVVPSGGSRTAEKNSKRTRKILMYCYEILRPPHARDFFDTVALKTYGDDNASGLAPDIIDWYNCLTVSQVCKDKIGLEITPACKKGELLPFTEPKDVVFLKRHLVWDNDLAMWKAPLLLDSIYKTLTMHIPSGVMTVQDQMLDSLCSAMRELFFHLTESSYTKVRHRLRCLYSDAVGVPFDYSDVVPSWDDLYSSFKLVSTNISVTTEKRTSGYNDIHVESLTNAVVPTLKEDEIAPCCGRSSGCEVPNGKSSQDFCRVMRHLKSELATELKELEQELDGIGNPLGVAEPSDVFITEDYAKDMKYRQKIDDYVSLRSRYDSCATSIALLDRALWRHENRNIRYESETTYYRTSHDVDRQINLSYKQEDYMIITPTEDPCTNYVLIGYMGYEVLDVRSRCLSDLLFYDSISFESHDSGEQKSGKVPSSMITQHENMHDIDGAPPGLVAAGLKTKSPSFGDTSEGLASFLAHPVLISTQTWTAASHIFAMIEPWKNLLAIPSIRAKLRNFSSFRGTLVLRVALAGNEFMYGRVLLAPMYWPLQNAVMTILNTLYATYPTAGQYLWSQYFSQQTGAVEMDPKENRPVEIRIPFVSPIDGARLYNNATTSLAAGTEFEDMRDMVRFYICSINSLGTAAAVGTNAAFSIYGFIEDLELGAPTGTVIAITTESNDERVAGPIETFATRASEVASALAVVPSIAPLATASSRVADGVAYLSSLLGWSVATVNTAPSRVKPMGFQNSANVIGYDTGSRISLDPKQEITVDPRIVGHSEDEETIAYIASRESLLCTFDWNDAIASMAAPIGRWPVAPACAGKIAVGSHYTVLPTALHTASNYFWWWRGDLKYRVEVVCSSKHRGKLMIGYEPNCPQQVLVDSAIDLNKQHILVIDLAETQCVEFTVNWTHPRPWLQNTLPGTAGDMVGMANPTSYFETCNGYLWVAPLNRLQSPNASSVQINVFVKCENLRVNQPCLDFVPLDRTIWAESSDVSCEEVTEIVINPTGASQDCISEMHFGEEPYSFRSLLHRFMNGDTVVVAATGAGGRLYRFNGPILPPLKPLGTIWTSSTLFDSLRYCFLTWRGGLKRRFSFNGLVPGATDWCTVSLNSPTNSTPTASCSVIATYTNDNSLRGTITMVPHTNGGIEFELPFYTNNNFAYSQVANPFSNSRSSAYNYATTDYYVEQTVATAQGEITCQSAYAAAEDFSFMRWTGSVPYTIL